MNMKVIKKKQLLEKVNREDKIKIKKTGFLGVVVDKKSYKEKLDKKNVPNKKIGVLYNLGEITGSRVMTIYRFQRKNEIKYFVENITNKNIKEKRAYISYFFTKKPKKKDVVIIHSILKS